MISIILVRVSQAQTGNVGFANFGVTTSPKIVSAQAKLQYLMQLTTVVGNYATGDYITFDLPGGYFLESTDLTGCSSVITIFNPFS